MRFAARLLSFILCFELIMGGITPSIMMSSTAIAGDCPAGTSMDTTLNRCLTSDQVANIKMAVASCDTGSAEDQQRCYENNAQSALNAKGGKGDSTNLRTKSPLLRVGTGAAIAVPLFLLTHNLFRKKSQRMVCKPASLMLMYAGAGVLLGGEVITYFSHKKKLKKMKDRWKEIATPKSGASADTKRVQQTEAQSQAFEFLAQNEDSIAKTANTKFIYYASAAGLFAAGAVMAVVEKVKLTAAIAAEKAAMLSGNTAAQQTAQKEIDRISCIVSKGEASKRACEDGGGRQETGKDGKIACVKNSEAEQKEKNDAKDEKRKKDMDPKKLAEEEAAKAKAKEEAKVTAENTKNENTKKADTKLAESKAESEKAYSKLDAANKNAEKLKADGGKPYEDALIDQKNAKAAYENAYNKESTDRTNLNNIQNDTPAPTVAKPAASTQTTSGTPAAEPKKKINLGGVATKVAEIGMGSLFKPGENKGSPQVSTQNNPIPNDDKGLCEMVALGKWDGKDCTCDTGKIFDEDQNKCVDKDTSIETLRSYKLKKTAQHNLDNSKNAYELLELEKELENIEFENYSKITNYDDIDVSQFKSYSFAGLTNKFITNMTPMSDAHAMTCDEDMPCPNGAVCENGSCGAASDNGTEKPSPTDTKQGIGEIIKGIFSNPFKGKAVEAGGVLASTGDQVDKAIGKPLTRAAINAVFGTWIGIMSADFKEQANISKKRAEVLRGMKDEFATNGGLTSCTDAERTSPSKPECYCYTAEGKRNSSRGNSATCQKMWGTFNGAGAGDYLADNTKVCLDLNSNVDASCACRSQKGPDGKNTCMKAGASSFNLTGLNTGSFKMLNAGTSTANDLVNGVLGAGQIDGAAAANNAMRIRKAAEDMLAKNDPSAALAVKKLSDNIANTALRNTAGLSMGGGDSGSSLANMSPAQAVKSLDEELKKETTQDITTAGSSETVGAGNSAPEQLEFGMTNDDLAIQEDQIAEVMNKDLDMDTGDINKGSDTNLFEVLSNRYQRSGMRRLFDVDGKTKADKASESDISQ